MDKNRRIQIKLILILAGIILLAVLAVVNLKKMQGIIQKEGEYVTLDKALLLLETVEPSLLEREEYTALKEAENGFMTYGQYVTICNLLQTEEVTFPAFEKEYKEEYFITQKDYDKMFTLFLEAYDTENKLTTMPVTILGAHGNIILQDGTQPEEGKIAASSGVYEIVDQEICQYRFQTVEVYTYENKLITVKEEAASGYAMENIWIMESDAEGVRFYFDGYEATLSGQEIDSSIKDKLIREQIADFTFERGILTKAAVKTDKINGKILNIKEESVTIEGKGDFKLTDSFKAYRLYGNLEEIGKEDLIVGYDFTDFIIEDGKICAGLVMKEEKMESIRVLLKTADYAGMFHDVIEVTSDTDFTVTYGVVEQQETQEYKAGEKAVIEKDSDYFSGQRVYIEPSALSGKLRLLNVGRNQGIPEYRGKIELSLEEGKIVAVNEVLLEEYLYSVVPSEMPASYPEEALKAQAVCARTYAYARMLHSPLAEYGAHVDDSTTYQVYNNIKESAQATKAVKETAGRLLYYEEELVGAYYYSTSGGFGATAAVWGNDSANDMPYLKAKPIGTMTDGYTAEEMAEEENFRSFIQNTNEEDFEAEEGWYRWTYTVEEIDSGKIEELLKKRYDANNKKILTLNKDGEYESKKIKNIGKIRDIYVEKRLPGGVCDEIIIVAQKAQIKVISEYNIRCVLNNGTAKIKRQDGSEAAAPVLLPSAFFMISIGKEGEDVVGYTIIGGGFGHGVGMSQNGARAMAARDWSYEDILTFYYEGSHIASIY